jgi:mono/diheme cytochrome c family protein
LALAASAYLAYPASADDAQVARGRYLVTIAGCSDCHTPGALLGKPDMKRYLGGSDVGFSIPGQGVFVGQNLTPDKETGLGGWTDAQIIAAMRTGKTPE